MARLVARTPASRDAVTLLFQPNGHWQGLQAGQHVSIGVEIDGRRLLRSYSPTVLADGRLAITVKAITGGLVSTYLAGEAPLGAVVSLDPAFGDMLLPTTPAPLLLLAAGSGITPMRALLQAAAAAGMPMDVDLLYWVRQRDEACFLDEFEALAAAHPRLRAQLLTTREGAAPAPRIDSFPLEQVTALQDRHVMACGPGGFVQAARALAGPCCPIPGRSLQRAGTGRRRSRPSAGPAVTQRPYADPFARPVAAGRAGSPGPASQTRLPHGHLQQLRVCAPVRHHAAPADRRAQQRTHRTGTPVHQRRQHRPDPGSVRNPHEPSP